eukprot:TRINITY_DN554_c0_g1_i2.p2 TRINITY_DN554_c0_g1~~TRINITY_DN554_c0_g1_i2.p2  ORF type:complete len:97 (-),score=21.78 TRINITY_DN554_c0_g1_i2:112-402(-)
MEKNAPDVVSINTWTNTHEEYSIYAMEQGCHVFMEKPISDTVKGSVKISEFKFAVFKGDAKIECDFQFAKISFGNSTQKTFHVKKYFWGTTNFAAG